MVNLEQDNPEWVTKRYAEQLILSDYLQIQKIVSCLLATFNKQTITPDEYAKLIKIPRYQTLILNKVQRSMKFFIDHPECIVDLINNAIDRGNKIYFDDYHSYGCELSKILQAIQDLFIGNYKFGIVDVWHLLTDEIKEAIIAKEQLPDIVLDRIKQDKNPKYLGDISIVANSSSMLEIFLDRTLDKYSDETLEKILFNLYEYIPDIWNKMQRLNGDYTWYPRGFILGLICIFIKGLYSDFYKKYVPLVHPEIRKSLE